MRRIVPNTKAMVLVVDADGAYLEAATRALRAMGYRVIALQDMQGALEVLRSLTPDIVLTGLRTRAPLAVAVVGEADAQAGASPRFDARALQALVARVQAAASPYRSGMRVRFAAPALESKKA